MEHSSLKQYLPVLIVEDNEDDAQLIVHQLRRSGYEPFFERVWSARQMIDSLRRATWDIIICDYSMPGFNAQAALAILKASELDIPLILVSGTIGEEVAVAAMKAGASDYILKGNLTRLSSAIERELRESKERQARRQAEDAVRESADRLRQMAENVGQAFWLIDCKKNEVLYASPACTTILGYNSTQAGSEIRPWKLIHPDDRKHLVEAALNRLGRGRTDESYRIILEDGATRWLRERTFPILGARNEVVRLVGTAEDVTDRKALEERLRQSQKMDAVGQLAGGVAHDFNNILCVIQGYASMAKCDANLSPATREAVVEISSAADRACSLTKQLLAISRNQTFKLGDVDLNKEVQSMANMLQRTLGNNIKLKVDIAPALPHIRADAGMVGQILLNLGVNARDAMPKGGTLTISTAHVHIDCDRAPINPLNPEERPGEFLCLTVSDTGCGISAENLSRVFEPFFTTKPQGQGTGFGLAIVYGIVKQHDGWIDLASEVGKGTTFRIYLPCVADAPGVNGTKSTEAVPVLQS